MDKRTIRYSAKRAYFGKLTGAGLAAAYGQFKHTHDWDKPVTSANVTVGHIDGTVICRALWYEMSYNPIRFGQVSPFSLNRKDVMFRFCDHPVPEDTPGHEILEKLRHKMIAFMTLNGRNIGQWHDVVEAPHGVVRISLVDGHSDDNYKVLTKLREMIRIVVSQNLKDSKLKSYGPAMQAVICERHPNGIRGDNHFVSSTPKPVYSEAFDDRLLDAEDSAQITAETGQYRPVEQYEQAVEDLKFFKGTSIKQKTK